MASIGNKIDHKVSKKRKPSEKIIGFFPTLKVAKPGLKEAKKRKMKEITLYSTNHAIKIRKLHVSIVPLVPHVS